MGLAGCGSNTASTGGDSGEVVNLTYMHRLPDSEGMTLVKDIVAKWNKDHPNIQVKATKFDGAAQDMIKKLENRRQGRQCSGSCTGRLRRSA
jgi:multiple sugar transport system substrate-binding protein